MEEWKWVNGGQFFSAPTDDEDIQHAAPGSMPIEWSKRSDLLEWKNPWYSHGPETPADGRRSDPSIFCSESSPKTAPASCESAADDDGECRDPEIRCNGKRSGQAWTVALCALWGCRDAHGLEASLDFVGKVVLGLVPSELRQAFGDFENAIQTKKQELGRKVFNLSGEKVVTVVQVFGMIASSATGFFHIPNCKPPYLLAIAVLPDEWAVMSGHISFFINKSSRSYIVDPPESRRNSIACFFHRSLPSCPGNVIHRLNQGITGCMLTVD